MQSFQLNLHLLSFQKGPPAQNGLELHFSPHFQLRLAIIPAHSLNIFGEQVDVGGRTVVWVLFATVGIGVPFGDPFDFYFHLLEASGQFGGGPRGRQFGVTFILNSDAPQLLGVVIHDDEVLQLEIHKGYALLQRISLYEGSEGCPDFLKSDVSLHEFLKTAILLHLLKPDALDRCPCINKQLPATILSMRYFSNFNAFCKHSVFRSSSRTVCSGDGLFSGLVYLIINLYSSGFGSFYLLILFRMAE